MYSKKIDTHYLIDCLFQAKYVINIRDKNESHVYTNNRCSVKKLDRDGG